jgi:hypothetical protein
VILRRGNRGCVVPMHREINRGTLKGILEQAGVSTEEFMAALWVNFYPSNLTNAENPPFEVLLN